MTRTLAEHSILPPVLHRVATTLGSGREWAPEPASITVAETLLQRGELQPPPSAPLNVVAPRLGQLTWLCLREATVPESGDLTTSLLAASWSALSTLGEPVSVFVGSDHVGGAGVAIGLPTRCDAVDHWLSNQAPDLLWEPGTPPGWAVVADPQHIEQTLVCRPVAVDSDQRTRPPKGLTALTHMLRLPTARWCAVLVLHPLDNVELRQVADQMTQLAVQAGNRVSRSESINDHLSRSIIDPVAESVVQCLGAWNAVIDESLRTGGWRVGVHLCAASAADLGVIRSAFCWTLSDGSHGIQPPRAQRWDAAPCAPAGRVTFGWLSSQDLAGIMLPPADAAGQVLVRRPLPAGRRTRQPRRPIVLGSWLGTTLPAAVDVDDLAGHAFVAGVTGSGKSTTTSSLLVQLWNDHQVPFLVIDPAKADYGKLAPALNGGLRVVSGRDLRLNVLAPWPGRSIERHIALVGTAFRAAFGLPVPVPYVATLLLEQLGLDAAAGWALSLHDAVARLDSLVAELGYQGEIEENIRASLGLRLRLLLQPHRAERIAGNGPPTWITERPTLIALGDLGDEEECSFLAAMLVLYIAEAAKSGGESTSVRHVTVVEEAHRLMPEPRPAAPERGDAAAVASRLFTQQLAEVRAYGEALVIVDQSPAAVAREVIRNTGLKLAHRIVDGLDQETLGNALGLGTDEFSTLGSLTVGRCLLSSRDLVRPQAIRVAPPLLPPSGPGYVPLGLPANSRCHRADDAVHHHSSERHGLRAELSAALWAAQGGTTDLVSLLRVLAADDPQARPACLASVGIRRHVMTLIRIGHLPRGLGAECSAALWGTFMREPTTAPLPAVTRPGPFRACVRCPSPCVARPSVASAGLRPLANARASAARAPSASHVVELALDAALACAGEFDAITTTGLATAVGYCAAAHLAVEFDCQSAFLQRLDRGGDTRVQ